MKKTMFFIFSLALCTSMLKSMTPPSAKLSISSLSPTTNSFDFELSPINSSFVADFSFFTDNPLPTDLRFASRFPTSDAIASDFPTSGALVSNTLISNLLASYPQAIIITSDILSTADFFLADINQVPSFRGWQIGLPRNYSLITSRAITSLPSCRFITHEMAENIGQAFSKALMLIDHGQKTGQLESFSKGGNDYLLIPELLAIQLLYLNIPGINNEGHLDPRLTVLDDFIIDTKEAHNITPFIEDEPQQKKQSLSRALLFTNAETPKLNFSSDDKITESEDYELQAFPDNI